MNPVAPNTVAVMPLLELRPPRPYFVSYGATVPIVNTLIIISNDVKNN